MIDHDASTSSANGRWMVGHSTSHTTSPGIWAIDVLITSEWGTPNMIENGLVPEHAAQLEVRASVARVGLATA